MMWLQHSSKEELVKKRKYHEFIMKHFVAASCPRTPDSQNYMLVTYIDDPEPWEKASIGAEGRGLADNIRNFWRLAVENDLVVAPRSSGAAPAASDNGGRRPGGPGGLFGGGGRGPRGG